MSPRESDPEAASQTSDSTPDVDGHPRRVRLRLSAPGYTGKALHGRAALEALTAESKVIVRQALLLNQRVYACWGMAGEPDQQHACAICKKPADWQSPTGHWACAACRTDFERWDKLSRSSTEGPAEPVNLRSLMSSDPPEHEWMIEPLLLARKQTGIVAKRGERKSLLILDVSARIAAGHAVLDQPAGEPVHVVYIDMEMAPDDLWDRLNDFGWTVDNPDFDLLVEHLHYYQLIDLPPLDTEEGGDMLESIVEFDQAKLVVIDTVSRVISGDENTTETFRDLFRHTETRLKRNGVTLARLDHLGKDPARGSRGASAKEDALDVVFQLESTEKGIRLKKTKGRQAGVPDYINIEQEYDNGILRHVLPDTHAPQWLIDLVFLIDQLGLQDDAGVPAVQKALREKGDGRRRSVIGEAVRFRKGRNQGVPKSVPTPGTPHAEHPAEHPGTPTEETTDDQAKHDGNTHGNTPELSKGVFPPLKGGTPQTQPVAANELPDEPVDGFAAG